MKENSSPVFLLIFLEFLVEVEIFSETHQDLVGIHIGTPTGGPDEEGSNGQRQVLDRLVLHLICLLAKILLLLSILSQKVNPH